MPNSSPPKSPTPLCIRGNGASTTNEAVAPTTPPTPHLAPMIIRDPIILDRYFLYNHRTASPVNTMVSVCHPAYTNSPSLANYDITARKLPSILDSTTLDTLGFTRPVSGDQRLSAHRWAWCPATLPSTTPPNTPSNASSNTPTDGLSNTIDELDSKLQCWKSRQMLSGYDADNDADAAPVVNINIPAVAPANANSFTASIPEANAEANIEATTGVYTVANAETDIGTTGGAEVEVQGSYQC